MGEKICEPDILCSVTIIPYSIYEIIDHTIFLANCLYDDVRTHCVVLYDHMYLLYLSYTYYIMHVPVYIMFFINNACVF